jgi:hypothetical protein
MSFVGGTEMLTHFHIHFDVLILNARRELV